MQVLRSSPGKVFLVGAGPGEPDLLTIKGRRCLETAETVIHDRLVSDAIVDLAPARAERICVGKKGGYYGVPQETINRLMVDKALQGKQVVRLKGGDPFLFGRGGEEAEYLAKAGIEFEVVPGVSSALAVPATAGIPLTHREYASSVAVVTGFQSDDAPHPVRWDRLADSVDTLVVLMPLARLKNIVAQLVLHGRSLETPCALIESGTTPEQRQVSGTLRDIAARAAAEHIGSPAILVVGEVVRMSERLEVHQAAGSTGRLAPDVKRCSVDAPGLPRPRPGRV